MTRQRITRAERASIPNWLAGLRHTIEEINEPGLQRVFGTYDQKSISLDQLFEDLRSVSQMVCGDADVGTNGLPH